MKEEAKYKTAIGFFAIAVALLWSWLYPVIGIGFFMASIGMFCWALHGEEEGEDNF